MVRNAAARLTWRPPVAAASRTRSKEGRRALSRRSFRGCSWRRGTVFGQARGDTAPQSAQCGPGGAVNDRPSGNVEHQLADGPAAQENGAILLAGNIENALGEAYGKGEAGRARSPQEKNMFRA